jgi:hypothetical protein
MSKELNFTMTKEPKLSSLPFTLAITADTGVNNATDLNIKGACRMNAALSLICCSLSARLVQVVAAPGGTKICVPCVRRHRRRCP